MRRPGSLSPVIAFALLGLNSTVISFGDREDPTWVDQPASGSGESVRPHERHWLFRSPDREKPSFTPGMDRASAVGVSASRSCALIPRSDLGPTMPSSHWADMPPKSPFGFHLRCMSTIPPVHDPALGLLLRLSSAAFSNELPGIVEDCGQREPAPQFR